MRTFSRLALKDCRIENAGPEGGVFEFRRGEKILTSDLRPDGSVVVLRNFWVPLPCDEFFTGAVSDDFTP